MKTGIHLLVLFIAANAIAGEENATVSNETIPTKDNSFIRNETISLKDKEEVPDIIKNIAALYDKIGKKNFSITKDENTTASSNKLSTSNATQETSAETTLATTVADHKSNLNVTSHEGDFNETIYEHGFSVTTGEDGLNITEFEGDSVLNSTEENTHAPTVKKDDSKYFENNAVPEEDLHTTDEEDATAVEEEVHTSRNYESTLSSDEETSEHPKETYSILPELSTLGPQDHKRSCEPYIDKLLTATFSEHGEKLDPLKLENREMSIEANYLLGSVKGEIGLYDGRVTGLSKVKIAGECKLQAWGDQIVFKSILSFDEIEISYRAQSTLMNLGPKMTTNGILDGSLAEIVIAVPKDGGIGKLISVRVKNGGRLKVDVKGLGPFNWALGLISEEFVNVFRLDFRRTIEREFKRAMQAEIEKINYP